MIKVVSLLMEARIERQDILSFDTSGRCAVNGQGRAGPVQPKSVHALRMERIRPQVVLLVGNDANQRRNRITATSALFLGLAVVVISGPLMRYRSAELDVSNPTTLISNAGAMKDVHLASQNQVNLASGHSAGNSAKIKLSHARSVPSTDHATSVQNTKKSRSVAITKATRTQNTKKSRSVAITKATRTNELKAMPTSLLSSNATAEADSPPTEEDIKLDRELSSAANAYDRVVGTVNFGDNLINIEPSAWHADDERQDP